MNKIINVMKKNYIYVNITFLLLTVYVILFPFIASFLEKIDPRFVQCPYLRMTGKPCPLCGGTRYVSGLYNLKNDITYLFQPFGIMMIVIICDLIFRIYNLITLKKEKSEKYVKIDIIIHILIIICFLLYELVFIILQNNNII